MSTTFSIGDIVSIKPATVAVRWVRREDGGLDAVEKSIQHGATFRIDTVELDAHTNEQRVRLPLDWYGDEFWVYAADLDILMPASTAGDFAALEQANASMHRLYDIAQSERNKAIATLESEMREELNRRRKELDEHMDTMPLWRKCSGIEREYNRERVRRSNEGTGLRFKIGTRFRRWECTVDHWTKPNVVTTCKPTSEEYVLQVFKPGDTVDRDGTYRQRNHNIKPGDLVLRRVLKSGKLAVECSLFKYADEYMDTVVKQETEKLGEQWRSYNAAFYPYWVDGEQHPWCAVAEKYNGTPSKRV